MTDAMPDPADVHHRYRGTPAPQGVSLTVRAGGRRGDRAEWLRGKSTLLHVAAGVLALPAGTVRLLGRDLRELSEADCSRLRRREVGIVLQYGQLVPDLPLVDNVALPLLLDGREPGAARAAAASWLDRVGLDGLGEAIPKNCPEGRRSAPPPPLLGSRSALWRGGCTR